MVRVYFIQQSHDFFAQAERPGVAGRGRALRQPHKAEETHNGGQSQPHVWVVNAAAAAAADRDLPPAAAAAAARTANQVSNSTEEDLLQF